MEVEDHVQFMIRWVAVLDTVGNISKAHFPNSHAIWILAKGCFVEHLEIVVVDGAVCVFWFTIKVRIVLEDLVLTDQVNDIKAEALDALFPPEIDYLEHLLADMGIAPVEVGLGDVKEVEIVFPSVSKGGPGIAAKLGNPVCWLIPQDKEILVIGIAS